MQFKLIFATFTSLTLLSGGTALGLSLQPQLTPQQEALVTTCTDTWKLSMGALVGLVSGRDRNLPIDEDTNDES